MFSSSFIFSLYFLCNLTVINRGAIIILYKYNYYYKFLTVHLADAIYQSLFTNNSCIYDIEFGHLNHVP